MIFRRKKNAVAEDPTLDDVTPAEGEEIDENGTSEDTADENTADENTADENTADEDTGEADGADAADADGLDVEALDGQDWRSEGPYDITEVESSDDDDEDEPVSDDDGSTTRGAAQGARIDLGSMILTGVEGMELRLQMAEETQQLVSAMMIKDDSALEVAAYAAPRSGGLWSELREEMVEQTTDAGGSHSLVAGPFGVELRRMLPVAMPDGEQGFQPSRMWVVEGQRWLLRGIVYGRAALEEGVDGPVEELVAAFRGIVVRRGNEAKAPGDLLPLAIPEDLVRAQEESDR